MPYTVAKKWRYSVKRTPYQRKKMNSLRARQFLSHSALRLVQRTIIINQMWNYPSEISAKKVTLRLEKFHLSCIQLPNLQPNSIFGGAGIGKSYHKIITTCALL